MATSATMRHGGACCVRFRPCIDIHRGKVKQIVGSTLSDVDQGRKMITNFETERATAEFAAMYRRDGLVGGHVIMLGADESSKRSALEAVGAFPGGLQLGGGVSSANAEEYLEAGASHVIVTSYVFRDGRVDEERLEELVRCVGKERIVLDLSCRRKEDGKYYVVTDRWQKFTDLEVEEETLRWLEAHADEFLVHGVDVEGKKLGVDVDLVNILGKACNIPVTYAGGVSTMEDLEVVKQAGGGKVDVTVGSALDIFGGDLPYEKVVEWHNLQQTK